jgi:urea transport system permease protein
MRLDGAALSLCLCLALCGFAKAEEPLSPEVLAAVKQLRDAAGDERVAMYQKISTQGDGRLVPLLQAFHAGMLEQREGRLVIYQSPVEVPGSEGKLYPLADAITLEPIAGPDGKPLMLAEIGSEVWKAPRKERTQLGDLIAALSLAHPDLEKRKQAIVEVGDRGEASLLPALKAQLERNPPAAIAAVLKETIARIELTHGQTREIKLAAAKLLQEIGTSRVSPTLSKAMELAKEAKDEELIAAIQATTDTIQSHLTRMRWAQNAFAGLSLGSILILLALGLSIIFGVMGVINMAHGEFMMVGAFTTLFVCEFFKKNLPPSMFDYYFIVALPAAFLVAGFVGYLCEMLVIRRLYGRPLETLLATWGISLVLIQSARTIFGDTSSLTPPSWLVGGWEIAPDLVIPLNRLFIIGLCAFCIAMVYYIVGKTKIGLLLRATTQNRTMASCLGVPTRRIDGLTFGLGAGLAGLAGVAVPLFDKINPQMGQGYIVDSFMVVVVGGVGKLIGAIVAGLGLGFITKFLEPLITGTGSVIYTKIIILLLIIAILQRRPSGLFPAKGRLAEA